MTPVEILESLRENYPDEELLLADGFEDAVIGLVDGACRSPVVCYDYETCIEILIKRGLSEEDAHEHMSFNVLGAYVGEYTPLFVNDWRKEQAFDVEEELEDVEVESLREQLRQEERQERREDQNGSGQE